MKKIKRFLPILLAFTMAFTPLFSGVQGVSTVFAEEMTQSVESQDGSEETATGSDIDVNINDNADVNAGENTEETTVSENSNETIENSEDANTASETLENVDSIYDDDEEADPIDASETIDPAMLALAIKELASALEKAGASGTTIQSVRDLLGRIGTGASLAGGTLLILQVLGLIDDNYSKDLREIKAILNAQSEKLNEISNQLNSIAGQLIKLQAQGILYNRATTARQCVTNYGIYKGNYLDQMELNMTAYQAWVVSEIKDWSYATKHDNLYAYYTMITPEGKTEQEKVQTYSRKKNMLLTMSEYGEQITQKYTIGLPGKYITTALQNYREQELWDADKYRADLVELLTNAVIDAMNAGELGCSEEFKNAWTAATIAERKNIAKSVAGDLFNSVVYVSSCKGVNDKAHSDKASQFITKMNQTWAQTKAKDGGMDSQITPIQMTVCFEGEAKDNIKSIYTAMTGIISLDIFFTMTIAGQLDSAGSAVRTGVRDQWLEAMKYYADTSKVIKGYDNYCYLTGTVIELKECKVIGISTMVTRSYRPVIGFSRFRACDRDALPWVLIDPSGNVVSKNNELKYVDGANATVLYMTWNNNKTTTGTNTFREYLNKYGTGVSKDFNKSIMAGEYSAGNYALTDTVRMFCMEEQPWESNVDSPWYFDTGESYQIMSDNDYKKHTALHEKVTASFFDLTDGTLSMNQTITARAQYWKKWWRRTDQAYYFAWKSSSTERKNESMSDHKHRYTYTTSDSFYILWSRDVGAKESTTHAEGEYDPDEIVKKMASCGSIDASVNAHTGEELLDYADWLAMDLEYLYIYESTDELIEAVCDYIDDYLAKLSDQGIEFEINDDEYDALVDSLCKMIRQAEKEMGENENIDDDAYLDPFNLYGNDTAMEKLAKAVLPGTEIATDGQTIDPVKNMIAAVFYEPFINIKVEKVGDEYTLKPEIIYNLSPSLLVWCDETEELKYFDISNDVIKELGLTMTVRFSAAYAGDNDMADIVHYDDYDTMNVIEKKSAKILGSGEDRYAEISVTQCSPFSVSFSKSAVNTGDNNNMTIYYIIIGLAAVIIVVAVIMVVRRRKSK